jgi:hypothetical protein
MSESDKAAAIIFTSDTWAEGVVKSVRRILKLYLADQLRLQNSRLLQARLLEGINELKRTQNGLEATCAAAGDKARAAMRNAGAGAMKDGQGFIDRAQVHLDMLRTGIEAKADALEEVRKGLQDNLVRIDRMVGVGEGGQELADLAAALKLALQEENGRG